MPNLNPGPQQSPRISGKDLGEMRAKMPMFGAYRRLAATMWNEGTLTMALRDMLRLKSASLAHCEY